MMGLNEIGGAETRYGSAQLSISGSPTQVIRIDGDVDLANAYDIDNRVSAAYRPDIDHVVVDLGGTTYLDSVGLAMLVRLSSRLAAARTSVIMVAPPESVAHRVIALSGLVFELALRNEWTPTL
ncbi:MAG TPA: STAS domain-containing protein [Ilumatobacter sp.]|jgi:anti-anti-sigma factor|nr:STAS domain-containing protein [Ilumatobacter sp.]